MKKTKFSIFIYEKESHERKERGIVVEDAYDKFTIVSMSSVDNV